MTIPAYESEGDSETAFPYRKRLSVKIKARWDCIGDSLWFVQNKSWHQACVSFEQVKTEVRND
jgi:hypothetical protein